MCKSRATHRALITCNLQCATWYEGTAQLLRFDRVEIAFILALFYWRKPLTVEGGEGTDVPGKKTPKTSFRKCHILKPENSSPKRDSNLLSSIGGRLGKQTC